MIDELKEAKDLFEQLGEILTVSWDVMYGYAKRYYMLHKDLNVPYKYKTPEGFSLGTWLSTQRKVYAGLVSGSLDAQKIKKLEAIGIQWDNRLDSAWNRHYEAARTYFEANGNLMVPVSYITDDGFRLGVWIANLRSYRKNGIHRSILRSERIEQLNRIGMVWDGNDYLWEQKYEAAYAYYKRHGNLEVPKDYVDKNGIKLYKWLISVRAAYRKPGVVSLSKERIQALNAIGMEWRTWPEIRWDSACWTLFVLSA